MKVKKDGKLKSTCRKSIEKIVPIIVNIIKYINAINFDSIAGEVGLEPTTRGLTVHCSAN